MKVKIVMAMNQIMSLVSNVDEAFFTPLRAHLVIGWVV
jgi:hypothetical protein